MEQTHDTTPAQTAPATPTTAQASKTQAKKTPEPSSETDFLKELKLRVHEAQCTPSMLLVPKVEMQGSTDAKLRVASRFLLQKAAWVESDGIQCEAELGDAFKSASQYFMGSVPTGFIKAVPKMLPEPARDAMGAKLNENFHVAFNFSFRSPKFVWYVPSSPAYMQSFVQAVSAAREKMGIEVAAWFDTRTSRYGRKAAELKDTVVVGIVGDGADIFASKLSELKTVGAFSADENGTIRFVAVDITCESSLFERVAPVRMMFGGFDSTALEDDDSIVLEKINELLIEANCMHGGRVVLVDDSVVTLRGVSPRAHVCTVLVPAPSLAAFGVFTAALDRFTAKRPLRISDGVSHALVVFTRGDQEELGGRLAEQGFKVAEQRGGGGMSAARFEERLAALQSAMEEKLEKQRGQFEAAVDGTRGELMDKIEEVTSTVETVVGAVSVSVEQASEAVVASVEMACACCARAAGRSRFSDGHFFGRP